MKQSIPMTFSRTVLATTSGTALGLLWLHAGPVGLGLGSAAAALAWGAARVPSPPPDPDPEPITPQSAQPHKPDFIGMAERLWEQQQTRRIEGLIRQVGDQLDAIERDLDTEPRPERWAHLQAKRRRWGELLDSLVECRPAKPEDPEEAADWLEFAARRGPMEERQARLAEAEKVRGGTYVLIPRRPPEPEEVERRVRVVVDALLAVIDGEDE